MSHEVTEQVLARKKAEEARESVNFRNALFEAQDEVTPDGVLIVDAKGKILLHNTRFAEIWNMPQEIIDSKDEAATLKHVKTQVVHPEEFIQKATTIHTQHNTPSHEEIRFKDGRVVDCIGTPIVATDSQYYGWAWFFRDITDRIRQEQKFRSVVEQATDLIAIFKGEDLLIEVANEALMEVWQVSSDALNKPLEEVKPELVKQGFIDVLKNVYRTGEAVYGYEIPAVFRRENGEDETVYFNYRFQPYHEPDGCISGVLVVSTVVNEQRAIKQQLIESEFHFRNMVEQAPIALL